MPKVFNLPKIFQVLSFPAEKPFFLLFCYTEELSNEKQIFTLFDAGSCVLSFSCFSSRCNKCSSWSGTCKKYKYPPHHWGGSQEATVVWGDWEHDNSASQESDDNSITIGIGKAPNMISVIKQEFGHDLSSYHYVSFAELWVNDPLPNEILPMRRILGDIFVECEVGDGLPLGFLYQGNEAYTTRKQSDSTLKLTKYKILTPEETQGVIDEDFCYQIVDTEVKPTTQAVVNALYGIE